MSECSCLFILGFRSILQRWLWLFLGMAILTPGVLRAVDLKNEDNKTYPVKVHEGASTTHTSISGGTTRINLTKTGTVEIIGAGTFRAMGIKRVIIRDGRLIFE